MKIQFLVDFRGRETNEQYFKAGEITDLENGAQLVAAGRAVEIVEKRIETPVTVADKKPVAVQVQHNKKVQNAKKDSPESDNRRRR